jgi:alpha-N-arabinofuranosidase
MILTPTYHVFDMYQVHQDAKLVPVQFNSPYYTFGTQKIPALNVSASLDSTGALNISFVNLDPHKNIPVETRLDSVWNKLSGRIITSTNLTDHNTFEEPNKITVMEFHGSKLKGRNLSLEIPSKSIVTITLR